MSNAGQEFLILLDLACVSHFLLALVDLYIFVNLIFSNIHFYCKYIKAGPTFFDPSIFSSYGRHDCCSSFY